MTKKLGTSTICTTTTALLIIFRIYVQQNVSREIAIFLGIKKTPR